MAVDTYYFDGSGGVTNEWTGWQNPSIATDFGGFTNPENVKQEDGLYTTSNTTDTKYDLVIFDADGNGTRSNRNIRSSLDFDTFTLTNPSSGAGRYTPDNIDTLKLEIEDFDFNLLAIEGYEFTEIPRGAGINSIEVRVKQYGASGVFYVDVVQARVNYDISGISDPDSVWTNDANAFDGSTGTSSSNNEQYGSTATNYLQGNGTNAPGSGTGIIQVRARIYGQTNGVSLKSAIYTESLGELLGTAEKFLAGSDWGDYVTLSTPTGGWSWSKLQSLETKIYGEVSMIGDDFFAHKVELEVTSETPPTVTTVSALTPTATTADITGEITEGTNSVTERGIVWDTSPNPDTGDNKVQSGSGGGEFTVNLSGLTANTTYYTRAYGIDSLDTFYGNEIEFTTPPPPPPAPPQAGVQLEALDKVYVYKVFDGGDLISNWTQEDVNGMSFNTAQGSVVTTDFGYNQEINNAGSVINLNLGKNPDEIGEDSDTWLNLDVDVFVYYSDSYYLIDSEGNRLVDDDGNYLIAEEGAPSGRRIFSGKIKRYIPRYSDNTIDLTLYGNGVELDNYLIVGEADTPVLELEQDSSDSTANFSTGGPNETLSVYQSFTAQEDFSVSRVSVHMRLLIEGLIGSGQEDVVMSVKTGEPANEGDLLGSTQIPVTNLTADYVNFDLDPIDFENGEDYFIELIADFVRPSSGGPAFQVSIDTTEPFANGSFWTFRNTTGVQEEDADMRFKLYSFDTSTRVPFLSTDPSDIAREIIDSYNSRGGRLRYDAGSIVDTETTMSYEFNTNTTLEGMDRVLALTPPVGGWYWYVDMGTNLIHLKPQSETPDHIFTLGKEILDFEPEHTIERIVNDVVIKGAEDEGEPLFARFRDIDSINEWGRGLERVSDSRLSDTTSMETIANNFFQRQSQPRFIGRLNISAGVYNIENIHIGQMVGFAGFNNLIDDLVLQIAAIRYSPTELELTLDSLPPKITRRIEDINRSLRQLGLEDAPDSPS